MPDIKLDTTTHLDPEDLEDPEHRVERLPEADVLDGDIIARLAEEDPAAWVGLPAAGLAQLFGNERERDVPD